MCRDKILFEVILLVLNLRLGLCNATAAGCNGQKGCMHCNTAGCIKCSSLIVYPSRECVTECPQGHSVRWSTFVDYMGQMCIHTGYIGGLTGETAAIVVGVCTGTLICLVIIIAGVLYLRYKKSLATHRPPESPAEIEDSPEKKDFLKQLEILRPHASTFLDMLNDTRRQIRELHGSGDNAAITAYRPVVQDLAKILLLLNRPVEKISVIPDDWDHIFSWAEKVLKRYKRMSDISQPQVAQLVSFLQTPVVTVEESPTFSQTLSTFKPDQQFGSALSLQDITVRNFNSNYDNNMGTPLNPQWHFNYSLVSNPVAATGYTSYGSWQNKDYLNNSYLLEDDFFQFGFRPQDEITTEL